MAKNNFAKFIAAAGALAGGYMQGKKMNDDQEWEKEKRQREREEFGRQEAERQAAADTLAQVGAETVDPKQAGAAVGVAPGMIERDIADFGPEGAKATINPATIAAAGVSQDAIKPVTYSREQANGDYLKRLYAINPTKAMQVEAQQMQLDEGRDRADVRTRLKRVDGRLREWGEKTFKADDSGKPIIDDSGMVHIGKMRTFLLSQEGLYDDAMKTADQSMQYATRKIQAETVQRAAETDKALALFDRGDYSGALKVYDMVPDGSKATGVTVGKDGSVTVSRISAVDGAKLPDGKFKSLADLRAAVESIKDPNAVINHVERTFRHDIESRRLTLEGGRLAVAQGAEARAKGKDDREQKRVDDGTKALADMEAADQAGDTKAYKAARLRAVQAGIKLEKPEAQKADVKVGQVGDITVTQPTGGGGAVVTNYGPDMKPRGSVTVPPAGQQSGGQVHTPKNESDFKALPSGAIYIDPQDGKKYRKP